MNYLLFEFLPLLLGAMLAPAWVIITLLLLRSPGGLPKAIAFAAGQLTVRLAQGLLFSVILGSSPAAQTEQGSVIIVSTLLLVLGILLWISAARKWLKEEDPDAPPPKWMTMFNSISAGKAYLFGILFMLIAAKQWVFTLGALGVIREAELVPPESIIAYLIFVLGASSLIFLPILLTTLAPKQSGHLIESAAVWLERNNRTIVIAVSVIFGTYFFLKGILGLLG